VTWFREWLQGGPVDTAPATAPDARPDARPAAGPAAGAGAEAEDGYPGQDFGLPVAGPDSVATLPLRGGQFLLDLVIAGVVAALVAFPAPPYLSLAVWAALVWLPVAVVGRTPAMALMGMRVARVDGAASIGPFWALARTVSLFFIVPAFIVDRDARGLQDRVSRTIVLRSR